MLDIAIIGGGPSGSVAGLLLARCGWQVLLIEQHRFPHEKVCGECLSPLALQVLGHCGLLPSLRAAGAVRLKEFAVYTGRRSARVALNEPMLGLSRGRFDSLLLEAARDAGAEVYQPARCEGIDSDGDHSTLQLRDLTNNQLLAVRPSHVLLADGKGALLSGRSRSTGDFGIKAHFADVDSGRDAIELFSSAGRYGGVAPVEKNRWNAAFSVKASDLADCRGDIDRLFARLCGSNRFLAERFARAIRCGNWLASPLPRFGVRSRWSGGIIPIGNAAAALEPIGGEGMGLALRSAELTAEFLLHANGRHLGHLQAQFRKLWTVRRIACRTAARLMASPLLGGSAVALLASSQTVAQLAMRLTGKPRHGSSSLSQISISDAL